MINLHVKDKMKHAIKFYTFLNRNPDISFPMKKRVAEACVFSSILYGTETWFTENFGKSEPLYKKIIKALLDVQHITCNVCLVEATMMSLKAVVKRKMQRYLQAKVPTFWHEDPMWKALELNRLINTKTHKCISNLLGDQSDIIKADQNDRNRRLKQNIEVGCTGVTSQFLGAPHIFNAVHQM